MENMQEALKKVTVKQASKELNMDVENVRYMMQKERLPIGYAIKRDGKERYSYVIYRGMLDKYKESIAG